MLQNTTHHQSSTGHAPWSREQGGMRALHH